MFKHITLIFILILSQYCMGQVIHVPVDHPTIQKGIDAAKPGDTVLVAEGTYFENLNFKGKAITLASYFMINGDEKYIDNTIIDGSHARNPDSTYTIYFINNEDTSSVLLGFTLRYRMFRDKETGVVNGGSVYSHNSTPKTLNNKNVPLIGAKSYALTSGQYKPKTYITWINLIDSQERMKGCLYQLNDSSVSIVSDRIIKQDFKSKIRTTEVNIDQVENVKIRRKGSVGKGILIGTLSGFAIGAIVGFISGDSPSVSTYPLYVPEVSSGSKALAYGLLGGAGGAALGGVLGAIKIKIQIKGSHEMYNNNRERLKKFSVK